MARQSTSIDRQFVTDEPPSYKEALNSRLPHENVPTPAERFFPESSRHTEVVQQQPPPVILIQNVHTHGSKPCLVVCPNCQSQQLTDTDVGPKSKNKACQLALLLFVLATLMAFKVFLNKINKH